MHIDSTRFGPIEIRDDAVVTFPDGIIGLPGTRYALLAETEASAFLWLHSVEDPSIALPVTNPWFFFPGYAVDVSDEDAARLGLDGADGADIFCVVRAAESLEDFTVNLRGPIVVNGEGRVARQVINQSTPYGVREPLFSEVHLEQARTAAPATPLAATGV
jgi:flagellar assembly factor FliW